jgi:serine/threonine protein kinase/WD40 repeat protein
MASEQVVLRSIFCEALDRTTPEHRAEYLDEACRGEPELRARVEALLRAHEQASGFLNQLSGSLSATIDELPSELPSTVIGPYKLLQPIGEGGMGVVWMAEQEQPVRRKVAFKLIKPGMDSRQVIARFEAERQALALMDHHNIAKVLDAGTTDSGRPYFVMELIHGIPITQFCDDNQLTPCERLELFVPVCQAIQHAHQKGIIHRDIKPSNVLVTHYDGKPVPKIIDFGVAKAVEQRLTERTLFTQYGTIIGTFEYMSPEQAEMSALGVDTRSDIYSLGVLLYELLTGTTPLERQRVRDASYPEIVRLIREEELTRPSTRLSCCETLPAVAAARKTEPAKLAKLFRGELDWIVMKALEKDLNRRYETANSFAMDVQRHLAGEAVRAVPPSAWYRFRKFARRNKGPVTAVAVVLLALVAGIIGTTWGMLRASNAEAGAVAETGLKEAALEEKDAALTAARQSKWDADEKLFASYLAQARALRVSRRPGQRFESLETLRQATELARTLRLPDERFQELRDAAVAALALPDLYPVGPWVPLPADVCGIDFDAAHTVYVRTDRRGNCSVRRVADDGEVHHLPGRAAPAWPRLSADGKFLAVGHYTEGPAGNPIAVEVWKLGPTAALKVLSEEKAWMSWFHPRLPQCALVYADGAIALFELPSGQPLKRLPPVTLRREVFIALHPTESVVAVCSRFGSVVQLRDLGTGAVLAELPHEGLTSGVAWDPDGRTLAVGQYEPGRIRLYDRATLGVRWTLEPNAPILGPFNPAGDRLVSTGWYGFVELFDVGTGQKLFTTRSASDNLHFSRDGRRLAGAILDGKLGSWQVGDGREYRTLVRQRMPEKAKFNYSVAVSPDGRLVAAGMADGIGLWDLASGSELDFVPLSGGGAPHVRALFEPSGALLVLGPTGLSRWPIGKKAGAAGQWVMGPPQRLPLPRGSALGQSRDGRVTVTCSRGVDSEQPYAGGWILHADRPNQPIHLDPCADIGWITVSHDGRWVVTATHGVGQAKIWDARDGRLVRQLAEVGAGYARFSPDGRSLSTDVDGGRLFAVGTWEPGPRLGSAGTFTPDGKLVAVPAAGRGDRLVDPATGRTLATLEDPNLQSIQLPVFTPDGTRLIGVGNDSKGIRVWDLRLVRQHLTEMGLDWDAPPYPPADPEGNVVPLHLEVRLGDQSREERARQAIDQYRRALEKNADDAKLCNSLAWVYLTAPEGLRDVKAALPLAEKAVRLVPACRACANTLGVSYYRAGRYRQAVDILRPNLARQEDLYLAFDLYFLAMSYHKLGETARARDYYELAVRWPRSDKRLTPDQIEELDMFRAEANKLLGIASKGGVQIAPPPQGKK